MPRPKRKAAEAAEVAAKKARGETDLQGNVKWHQAGDILSNGVYPLMYLVSDTLHGCEKVAGFDIDFTIVETRSGRKFATGPNDWQILYPKEVPEKLKALHKEGYRLIFFTNQAGVEKLKVTPEAVMEKVEGIIRELDLPIYAFVSTGNSHFRKPATGMWEFFVSSCNKGVDVDLSESIYVGDAAGRPKGWAPGKPKDFSCSDRMFAANIGVPFKTPEEFFLGEKPAKFDWGSLNPVDYLAKNKTTTEKKEYHAKSKEMVIMVGPPASGKSTFSRRYLKPHGYEIVNRDTLGTAAKCIKGAQEALKAGKRVVVDNTNPSVSARSEFLAVAKKAGASCRCFWLQTPMDMSHHLNYVRQSQTNGKVRRIPDVGYNVFKKNMEEPTKAEGFTEVQKINFVPKFDSKRDEAIFKQWTTAGH